MQKISVILVVLNKNSLDEALGCLNFNAVQLEAVIIEGGREQPIQLRDMTFSLCPFTSIEKYLQNGSEYIWLLNCDGSAIGSMWRMAKFLLAYDVPKDNIVNFTVAPHISWAWLGNLKYIEANHVDFFTTGISYAKVGIDLEQITGLHGVTLAGSNQDLRQAFLTAQYVFERQDSVKFVLIGLAPYSFRYENLESFSVCSRNLQYLLGLKNSRDNSVHGQLLRMVISDKVKQIFSTVTSEDADPNFVELKKLLNKEMKADTFFKWENELQNVQKEFRAEVFERNLKILEQYIQLCLEHGAKPIGIILPFAPIINRQYPREQLSMFRRTLEQLKKAYDFDVIDLFDLPLGYKHFYNLSHLNIEGAKLSSILINYELFARKLKSIETMLPMTYDALYELIFMINPKKYTAFESELHKTSAGKIRRRNEKIKIGFVLYDASMWCGDDLYQLFEQSERYEPTVFLCLRRDKSKDPIVVKDFHYGVRQFQSRGLNVVGVENDEVEIPKQDVLLILSPYIPAFAQAFQFETLTAETLLVYIPYGMSLTTDLINYNLPSRILSWLSFYTLKDKQRWHDVQTKSRLGWSEKYLYSGQPKFDYFLRERDERFEWKEAQPNSVKIIYAPHWTINVGMKLATFQFNHEFFYEYAKAHPETSWVFKPHPNLLFAAVEEKIFPNSEAFEEYLRKWDELPNASVVTGAYYQSIFASSDGMILDSASFLYEYQYTHKPLLFLTRGTQNFIELGEKLMQVLYRADGRDLNGIAKFIDEVLIKKRDSMSGVRQKFFDQYLNYVKDNGMTASQYIFNTIDRGLGGAENG